MQKVSAGPLEITELRGFGAAGGVALSTSLALTSIPINATYISLAARNFQGAGVARFFVNPRLVIVATTDLLATPGVHTPQEPTALSEFGTQVIVLDDGFQHRRIARDLDIVLIDALAPFGFDHIFPRGLLREPVRSLARADAVVLSRADLVDPAQREAIRRRVAAHADDVVWVETSHVPTRLITTGDDTETLDALSNRRVAAFCGIGNPEGFLGTLRSAGYDPIGFRSFPDHHGYERQDIDALGTWASGIGADALVCTVKDLVKIDACRIGKTPLWALAIDLEISGGAAQFEAMLADVCPASASS